MERMKVKLIASILPIILLSSLPFIFLSSIQTEIQKDDESDCDSSYPDGLNTLLYQILLVVC
jgi:hypothetical protein